MTYAQRSLRPRAERDEDRVARTEDFGSSSKHGERLYEEGHLGQDAHRSPSTAMAINIAYHQVPRHPPLTWQ